MTPTPRPASCPHGDTLCVECPKVIGALTAELAEAKETKRWMMQSWGDVQAGYERVCKERDKARTEAEALREFRGFYDWFIAASVDLEEKDPDLQNEFWGIFVNRIKTLQRARLPPPAPVEHSCEYRAEAEALRAMLAAALNRLRVGGSDVSREDAALARPAPAPGEVR